MKLNYLALLLTFGSTGLMAAPTALCHSGQCVSFDPDTLALSAELGASQMQLSAAQSPKSVSIKKQTKSTLFFVRDQMAIDALMDSNGFSIQFKPIIKIEKQRHKQQVFPVIKGSDSFLLPMLVGRNIPTDDPKWIDFLTKKASLEDPMSGTSDLSMQFLSAIDGDHAAVYLIDNEFNNQFWFTGKQQLALSFRHTFNSLNQEQPFGFSIKLTDANPATIAKLYRQHKIDQGKFVSLSQKAKIAPDVTKLYGAPFIYLWGGELIGNDNINWKKLQKFIQKELKSPSQNPTRYFTSLAHTLISETGNEQRGEQAMLLFAKEKWLYTDLKSNLDTMFRRLVIDKQLWDPKVFAGIKLNAEAKSLIDKGVSKLNAAEQVELNKYLIQSAYADYIKPVSEWGNGISLQMLKNLQGIGLKHAWLGLNDRMDGIIHRNVIAQAVKDGYLIAPYDSYSTLQKPGANSWSTAIFQDKSLYERGAVVEQDGQYFSGYLGRGRRLNPSLAMPEVKYRLHDTVQNYQVPFNSWFVDVDGAGALKDDFSPKHPMTQAEDAQHRLSRMHWIAKQYKMVIGTEDGKDYSAPVAVYGHGMVTPVIWTLDMARNKDSKYYLGNYWSPFGIPSRYGKETPLMPWVRYIYFNPKFEVPLFQMVYNDSIITSDHWEYSTLKFPEERKNNLLKTFLYNYPPLLHLDRKALKHYQPLLKRYLPVWSKWHHQLVQTQMSGFDYPGKDKLLQRSSFSDGTQVIANFSEKARSYKSWSIPAKSIIIVRNGKLEQRFSA